MVNEYRNSLEFTLAELKTGLEIAKEDLTQSLKENSPYFIRGALSSFFSLLPFQERHELTQTSFSKWTIKRKFLQELDFFQL